LIEEKSPSVEVIQDLPVSTDQVPPTDAADDFEIDRELGIVSQYDVFGPFLTASNKPTKKPSVDVIEGLDVTDAPAVKTDPADDFEIDREAGLVPEWDVYVPPTIIRSVSPDPLDEWDEIELPEPEIPLPEIPAPSLSMSDASLLDLLMGLDMNDMDVSYMNYGR